MRGCALLAAPRRRTVLAGAALGLLGCGAEHVSPAPHPPRTTAVFDLAADLADPGAFYDLPYPSDLRLTRRGTPDLTGFPYPPDFPIAAGLREIAMDRPGFPVVPVAYFRFSGPLAPRDAEELLAADGGSPVLLVDLDAAGSPGGRLLPVVATTPAADAYVPEGLLAAAPRPGIVLRARRRYAFAVTRALLDAAGEPAGASAAFEDLKAGRAPSGAAAPGFRAAAAAYAPLWPALEAAGVDPDDVIAATVFTTGDVVEELFALSTAVLAQHEAEIHDLRVDPDDGSHAGYCELVGQVRLPQFQRGTPPFDAEGLFDIPADGLPRKQRDEEVPIAITLPEGEMPAAGYPLVLYFHGSGGRSSAIADRGRWAPEDDPSACPEGVTEAWMGVQGCHEKGAGPAHVLAPHGLAMAASALPVNPERLPGATDTEYLNFNNLGAGRDLFRQGAIEQRLFLEALLKLEIEPGTVASCAGVALPPGAPSFRFDPARVVAQGQSMGGMYANLVGAVEPRVRAVVPTGAGGHFSHFLVVTPLQPNPAGAIGALLLGTSAELTFMHPALHLFATAWEAVDPIVAAPRLARRPLEGHPARPVYQPVGLGDSYFPEATYDAMALAYGNRQAGEAVWPSMQEALALEGRDGVLPYPASDDVASEDGARTTGVVVQYRGDGVYDPHAIYTQLDGVKHQYGCFFSSLLGTGKASVPAPAPPGAPCPD
ncbi:hypothetical protein WMF30_37560 [Sorangium sp. So ce134]